MFESLTDKLSRAMKSLRGQSKLTESNIEDALREVRMALLEADVHVQVARAFLALPHHHHRKIGPALSLSTPPFVNSLAQRAPLRAAATHEIANHHKTCVAEEI